MKKIKWDKLSLRTFETTLGKDQVFIRPSVVATKRNPLFEIRINGKLIASTKTIREAKAVVERLAAATRT